MESSLGGTKERPQPVMKETLNQEDSNSRLATTILPNHNKIQISILIQPGARSQKNRVSRSDQHEVFLRTRSNSTLEGLQVSGTGL